jgi:DNA primase
MARIARRSIEEVRERADLAELVESRTGAGRRSGGQLLFRCPFHDERTPSFSVDPANKLYHCFGCGRQGDLFRYVEELEGLDFTGAVEHLADRYGIELEYEEVSPRERGERDRTRRVEALLEDVAAFYERYLAQSTAGEAARAYLDERGVGAESVARFRLGLAPQSFDRVVRAARGKGYADEELYAAGVASSGRSGPIDRFRGRLVFPLCDARGRVRGFGARILPGAGDGPKYLNSPESDVFHKGRILYGLHLARASIARLGRALVVEGYMDVIALHGAGHEHAVAAMGTSLTELQLRELRRLAPELQLCFDADAAGQEAAVRGMQLAEAAGFRVRVVPLPVGRDPADILAEGPERLQSVLDADESVLSFRTGRALSLAAERGSDVAYEAARALLAAAPPGPERDEQQRRVAGALRLTPGSAAALVPGRARPPGQPGPAPTPAPASRRDWGRENEVDFLAACLALPSAGRAFLAAADDLIADEGLQRVLPWVKARAETGESAVPTGETGAIPEILALIPRYPVETSDDERRVRGVIGALWVQLRLHVLDERIARLKESGPADDYSAEGSSKLIDLQRERARLRDLLSRGGDVQPPS